MADIEAIAQRIFKAWVTATGQGKWRSWDMALDKDSDIDDMFLPGRDTFRYMAGASLPPITGTLDLSQEDQVMVESY